MVRDQFSRSEGGVCNNCGEPEFTHLAGKCADEERLADLSARIDQWQQCVGPGKSIKDRARDHLARMRRQVRQERCPPECAERAGQIYELAREQYETLIRHADKTTEVTCPKSQENNSPPKSAS